MLTLSISKTPTKNFTYDFLVVAANIVKNSDEEKQVYIGYEITIDGKGEWSFSNDSAIFGVDNSSPSYTDNCKKKNIS